VRVLLVDDEPLARRELRRLLAEHRDVEVVGESGSADDAERAIAVLRPDLVFLDIHMPQRDGFELLESLAALPRVVFTTAHEEHALRAFEVGALDYLLKPVEPARLAAALARARERGAAPDDGRLPLDRPLLVRDGARSWFVCLRDVPLIESAGNYCALHVGDHRPLLLHSLTALERRLDPEAFFRASRAALVNLGHVERFETGPRLELVAHLREGRMVTFSRRQSQVFRKARGL
jgi:two-component system LytT family response regulator